tara:strand:+ start:248 stop:568 length:321 start_codon:yes stop_codon:yes gene_type:complete
MSDIYDKMAEKAQTLTTKIVRDGKKYIKNAITKGGEIGKKGKIQVEIEKMKWDLKQKHAQLGAYVSDRKIQKSMTDFSHDTEFLKIVNAINTLKVFIEEREKEKGS